MAEVGIGIAASISGLISLAGTISVKLYGFLESVADAPASIRASMILMDEMSMVLASIERLISGLTSIRGKRKDMIHVRHLVFIFRDLIQSFSELEATINSLNGGAATKSKINRLRWVMEEKKIATCVQRIEKQKEWLDTILLVLMWYVGCRIIQACTLLTGALVRPIQRHWSIKLALKLPLTFLRPIMPPLLADWGLWIASSAPSRLL